MKEQLQSTKNFIALLITFMIKRHNLVMEQLRQRNRGQNWKNCRILEEQELIHWRQLYAIKYLLYFFSFFNLKNAYQFYEFILIFYLFSFKIFL